MTVDKKVERPLSPHLQVYRLPITARTSILHRMAGAFLAIGTILVTVFLSSAALGEDAYNCVMDCLSSPLGKLALLGWSAALFYHLTNGIRHMIWDTGAMLDKSTSEKSGYVVILIAAVLTAATWYCAMYYVG